jgi:hypothetical protein
VRLAPRVAASVFDESPPELGQVDAMVRIIRSPFEAGKRGYG